MNVQRTTNYDLFKFASGNRGINESRVKKLTEVILAHNQLEIHPLRVNKYYEILDGQHRLEVARRNNLDVYFFIDPDGTIDDAISDNTYRWNWGMQDFLNRYVEKKYEDYIILKQFCDRYGISISNAIYLLTNKTIGHEHVTDGLKSVIERFKRGEFRVTTLKQAVELADKINDIKEYVEPSVIRDRNFISALRIAYKTVNHRTLVSKLKQQKTKFPRKLNIKDYLRGIEDIYNYKAHSETRLY